MPTPNKLHTKPNSGRSPMATASNSLLFKMPSGAMFKSNQILAHERHAANSDAVPHHADDRTKRCFFDFSTTGVIP